MVPKLVILEGVTHVGDFKRHLKNHPLSKCNLGDLKQFVEVNKLYYLIEGLYASASHVSITNNEFCPLFLLELTKLLHSPPKSAFGYCIVMCMEAIVRFCGVVFSPYYLFLY
jgi:hypothetical protein